MLHSFRASPLPQTFAIILHLTLAQGNHSAMTGMAAMYRPPVLRVSVSVVQDPSDGSNL